MKISMRSGVLIIVLSVSPLANATPIAIANHDFEDPALAVE
jgi:hypothetical protein